jgi:alkylhydroperoxidase family enzyme
MIGFLEEPASSDEAQRMFGEDLAELGYVMNFSRLWAYRPDLLDRLFALLGATAAGRLDLRARSILVTACASAFGDSYCSLSYGGKLARQAGAEVAAAVLAEDDQGLDPAEQCLAAWARAIARDPNATRPDQVAALREAGYGDADIFAMTVFIALRIALATVNDALGLHPDAELADGLPPAVRAAVTFGRPVARACR